MAFNAHVLQVLIASPSDTKEERDAVEQALHGWNSSRAEREQVLLLPRRWEMDSVPSMGGDGQEIINSQLVDKCDIVIALFSSKLGQATPRAVSGTAEEMLRAMDSKKPVHVYFSDAPVPRNSMNSAQEVEDFRTSLQSQGLLGSYSDPNDLGYQVRQAIESDLDRLNLAAPTSRVLPQLGADPVAKYLVDREQHLDSRGKIKYRDRNTRLLVENHGGVTAEGLTFELTPLDGQEPPRIMNHNITPNIPARGEYSWPIMRMMGTTSSAELIMRWNEEGEERTKTQTVALA